MISKVKKLLQEITVGEEIVIETDRTRLVQTYICKLKYDVGKQFSTKRVGKNYLKISCTSTFDNIQEEVELKFSNIPSKDYILAKFVVEKVKYINTYIKAFITDLDEFKNYLTIVGDKNSFYLITTGIAYRKGEYKIKRVR